MNDNDLEMLPHVNETGETIGSVPRGKCHNGSMILHPVVHLHVFNAYGELFCNTAPRGRKYSPTVGTRR